MSQIIHVTEENFGHEVLDADGLVLVDFWAPWCGPCRNVAPLLEQLAQEWAEQVKIVKVNVDEQQMLAIRYHISSIPTFLVFRNGKMLERLTGAMPKTSFVAVIKRSLLETAPGIV